MMPDPGTVIHTLTAGRVECTQFALQRCVTGSGDDDKPVLVLHRNKGLRPQRVAFDHANGDWLGAGLSAKDAYQRIAAFGRDIHTGKIVKTLCRSFIDRQALCASCFNHISEGRERFFG